MSEESQKRLDMAVENYKRGNRGLDSAVGCLTLIVPLLVPLLMIVAALVILV